ncbi:transposase [Parvibaculum sedimenti]|uniref:Transposase n=1 Tax=Parvibaculum sedimenti TaxID=2608632 RepID=A0A6N6VLV0_9HYPH|nr:transposase [Parvibaculum sedimenti]
MGRRIFNREFKLEAVNLVRERGVTIAQAVRDLDVHQNVLRKWIGDWRSIRRMPFPAMADEARTAGDRTCFAARSRSSRRSATSLP